MYYFTKYTYRILDFYQTHMPLEDTVPIGFTGVAAQRPAPVFTNEVSEDVLLFAAFVDFDDVEALVRIRSQSPQYEWMSDDNALPQDTPINAIAGVTGSALVNLPLIQPFFLKRQGRLQMQFTNSTTAPITGGTWTWRGLRLTNPINGTGWDYSIGLLSQ